MNHNDYSRFIIENFRDEIVKHYSDSKDIFSIPFNNIIFSTMKDDLPEVKNNVIYKMLRRISAHVDWRFIHFIFTGEKISYDIEDMEPSQQTLYMHVDLTEFLEEFYNDIYGNETFLVPELMWQYTIKYFLEGLNDSEYSSRIAKLIRYYQFNPFDWKMFWRATQ